MMGILLAAAVAAETVACGGAHPPTVLPALVPKPRVAACTGGTYRHVTTNGWSEKDWYDFDRLGLCLAETPTTCRTDDSLPHEGYRLEVRKDGVTIVSADPAGEFYARQTLRQLYALINRLDILDRALVLLWLEGISYDEIGAIMGITPKNVSVKLVRIKQQLMNMSEK